MMTTHRSCKTRRGGIALVVTLCAVALLTVLVLAFFSRATMNRQVSFSSSNLLKSDLLARSSIDLVVSEIRQEIVDPGCSTVNTVSGLSTYTPKTSADTLPRRLGVTSPAYNTLVKVSADNTPVRPGGTIMGSPVTIDTVSRNGRLVSASRWFGTGGPRLDTQNTLPTWLCVTRGSGVKTPAMADAISPGKADYVIGRFAYTVYDTSCLFSANTAGYPTAAAGDAPYKSSSTYADLTALGLTSANVNSLVNWRNAATKVDASTFREWATGVARTSGAPDSAAMAIARSGFLNVTAGDRTLLSRRDLLKNVAYSPFASLLTHFNRSLNAPASVPATISATNPNLPDVRFIAAGAVVHYRDNGLTDSYPVQGGDILLQHRFSLAKLTWIGMSGVNATAFHSSVASADRDAAVRNCFGLTWDSANARWNYNAANASFQIKTLAEVAAEKREPNFFELIKAGILSGSVGKASANAILAAPEQQTREGNADLQILRIGANIIDCADNDNVPTTIALSVGGISIPVYGVEDLPYLYTVGLRRLGVLSALDATNDRMDSCTLVMLPQLFNPHRSGVASTGTPANIRISVARGTVKNVYNSGSGPGAGVPLSRPTLNLDLSTQLPIQVTSPSFENFRSRVKAIRGVDAVTATTFSTIAPGMTSASYSDVHGFIYYKYSGLPQAYPRNAAGSVIRSQVSNMLFLLQYQDSGGVWRTYDTLAGSEAFSTTAGATGQLDFSPNVTNVASGSVTTNTLDPCSNIAKYDPRTTRYGISFGLNFGVGVTAPIAPYGGFRNALPFGSGGTTIGGVYYGEVSPGLWVQGNKAAWVDTNPAANTNYPDTDNVIRPADGWLDDGANLFRNMADNARRPVILQRPYRSVGELGYVFRDAPWKSLNFFDSTSGDGALLDLFSLSDQGTVCSGRVALNAFSPVVQQSLLTGVAQAPDGTGPLADPAGIGSTFNGYAFTAGTPSAAMPRNVSQLATFISSPGLAAIYPASTAPLKNQRECIVRALGGNTESRTWNLLIDVVAQTGRFPSNAASLDQFLVEGEKRYWLSVAIDRFTGKVISQQLEAVGNE